MFYRKLSAAFCLYDSLCYRSLPKFLLDHGVGLNGDSLRILLSNRDTSLLQHAIDRGFQVTFEHLEIAVQNECCEAVIHVLFQNGVKATLPVLVDALQQGAEGAALLMIEQGVVPDMKGLNEATERKKWETSQQRSWSILILKIAIYRAY